MTIDEIRKALGDGWTNGLISEQVGGHTRHYSFSPRDDGSVQLLIEEHSLDWTQESWARRIASFDKCQLEAALKDLMQ